MMSLLKRKPSILFFVVLLLIIFFGRNIFSQNEPDLNQSNHLKDRLTAMQYRVTQENGTEPAFANIYHDYKEPGIYVDVVSGDPLFSSTHKYDSKTGWPSFTQPISDGAITHLDDFLLGYKRVEIRSTNANSHLGHLFDDGPEPTFERYCINSAALRFIHRDDLDSSGLEEYGYLFDK